MSMVINSKGTFLLNSEPRAGDKPVLSVTPKGQEMKTLEGKERQASTSSYPSHRILKMGK